MAAIQDRLDWIRAVLHEIGLPKGYNTEQTARTILALADDQPRNNLKSMKASLAEGAVLHDILEFVRKELKKPVKENTRESYRKHSLRPLRDVGLVTRHQASPNDPKTHYRLLPIFAHFIRQGTTPDWKERVTELAFGKAPEEEAEEGGELRLKLGPGKIIRLSPGKHNRLALKFAEDFVRFHARTDGSGCVCR